MAAGLLLRLLLGVERRSLTLFVWCMSVMVVSYATMHEHELLVIWSLQKAGERRIAGLTVPHSMNDSQKNGA